MAARARLTFIFPSGGKARGVESINFFRTCSCKADSNAVGRWRFTVARMCNNKGWLFATIKYPAIAKRAEVIDAKRTEDSIVKISGFFNIGCTDEDVGKTSLPEITGVAMIHFLQLV
jgi:hypothetical protein